MVKQTQTIRRELPTNILSVFNHFVELALKILRFYPYTGKYRSEKTRILAYFTKWLVQ